jgi:DNA polymerase/3'-5' exonuclease PolX
VVHDEERIADVLTEIGTLLELKGENPFKIRAYRDRCPRFGGDQKPNLRG